MSMEHKAFIFDFDTFSKELKPIIEAGLQSGDVDQIREFILSNKSSLCDPYEGESLEDDWEDLIEDKDIHQYGDFAITKYYSPTRDEGLGYDWEDLQDVVSTLAGINYSPILGVPLGLGNEYFDPGKMGSYFQDNALVRESLNAIRRIEGSLSENMQDTIVQYRVLLEKAANEGKGIYVTF
jgi:hypothetical protein